MNILVFTEGTVLMPSIAKGVSREERVKQSMANTPPISDFKTYIPAENALKKLQYWKQQGATIYYLTSRTNNIEIDMIRSVLEKFQFPDVQNLYYRKDSQTYAEVAEEIMPKVLIEDDCESIGGEAEMTYPHIKPEFKSKIHSIVVKEFAGIDYLPDNINDLLQH